jgi:hypothetical protein
MERAEEIPRFVEGATKLAYASALPVALVIPTTLSGGKTWR